MNCVERSISLFCLQDDGLSNLIIFNTDEENPVVLSDDFFGENITVVNNSIDYQTGFPYEDVGSIRRDALYHAHDKYYICWDDDDIFLPWNNRQCLDNILETDLWAWKPFSSMVKLHHRPEEISQNVMEASIISLTEKIKEFGYQNHPGGGEHMAWLKSFEKAKRIKVDKNSIPAYSFNWSDDKSVGGHKNSGSIKDPNNFEKHKLGCIDKHNRPLKKIDVSEYVNSYVSLLKNSVGQVFSNHEIQENLYDKYVKRYESH